MSGHSKWANIRIRKGAQDKKRGKIFSRHSKLIEMATREGGGGDPAKNARLATAIENAKNENVPNLNIERAIKKGTGELKGEHMSAVTYEAYGPGGAAFIIECLTDNKNRTLSHVKTTIEKRGGRWAESGAVMFLFDKKGIITATGKRPTDSDALELSLIDLGAEDLVWSDSSLTVTTDATRWAKVRDALRKENFTIDEAGLKFIPHQKHDIHDLPTAQKVMEFMEAIEEDDDVSEVHTNAEISAEIAAKIS